MSKKIFQIIVLTTMIISLGSMNNVMAGFSSDPDMPKKPKCVGKGYITCHLAKKECTWWDPKKRNLGTYKPGCVTNQEARELMRDQVVFPTKKSQ
jgi:hypothetical protein